MSTSTGADLRTDELTGVRTFVVDSRQDRPNLPAAGCPFCPGGLEAPEHYDVRWFPNRWPAMPDDRCEVVLYTPQHDATFWSLGPRARARSSTCGRSAPPPSARGPTSTTCSSSRTGAPRSARRSRIRTGRSTRSSSCRSCRAASSLDGTKLGEPGDRLVAESPGWRAWVPEASVFPYALRLAPDDLVPDLPSLDDAGRDALAGLLVDVLERFDRLFDAETPYMLWIHQRPFDGKRLAGRPAARRDRHAVARARRAALRRGRRAGLGRVLQPGRARGRGAVAARRRLSTHAKSLESLLYVGTRRSWELPELASLNRLPPAATLARNASRVRNLDGAWDFRLAARPEDAPSALSRTRGWHEVEVPGLWTMQGFGRPHYTNVVMPFADLPPDVPEQNETGIYRRAFTIPRGWRSRPVVLHFGGAEGALYVLVNGEPVGIAKDSADAGGVRRQRPRAPRRAERARRRRRPLVGRELRRGPGPVVARRAAALDPPRVADRARRRGAPGSTGGSR